mmetsp:Transcript_66706/g.195072  ORF Transcript_66706/g.195072 Transcript_66706/m.195072 type:complete len:204 (+) Transcript_66706:203-814(+)
MLPKVSRSGRSSRRSSTRSPPRGASRSGCEWRGGDPTAPGCASGSHHKMAPTAEVSRWASTELPRHGAWSALSGAWPFVRSCACAPDAHRRQARQGQHGGVVRRAQTPRAPSQTRHPAMRLPSPEVTAMQAASLPVLAERCPPCCPADEAMPLPAHARLCQVRPPGMQRPGVCQRPCLHHGAARTGHMHRGALHTPNMPWARP